MSKISHETSRIWPQGLALALLRFRIQVASKEKVSQYEMLWGRLSQVTILSRDNHVIGSDNLSLCVSSWGKALPSLHSFLVRASLLTLDAQVHPHQPGDCVYVRKQSNKALQEKWKWPFQVLPSTPAVIKGMGSVHWYTFPQGKAAPTNEKLGGNIDSTENLMHENMTSLCCIEFVRRIAMKGKKSHDGVTMKNPQSQPTLNSHTLALSAKQQQSPGQGQAAQQNSPHGPHSRVPCAAALQSCRSSPCARLQRSQVSGFKRWHFLQLHLKENRRAAAAQVFNKKKKKTTPGCLSYGA